MSNDKLAATTHGTECIKAVDEFRRSSGFLVSPSEYKDYDTRVAMIDRAADLGKTITVLNALYVVGLMAVGANFFAAFASALMEHEFWPPLLVGLFLTLVTGGLYLLRRIKRIEQKIIRTHLKNYFASRRDRGIHVMPYTGGHVAIVEDAGPVTRRVVRAMEDRRQIDIHIDPSADPVETANRVSDAMNKRGWL